MSMRTAQNTIPAAIFAAALAACGTEPDASATAKEASAAAGHVYTSEVESVSRWIRQGGGGADSADLVAAPNPRGEGVLVYSRGADAASGGERAAWMVVDSQVVPLNRASRRATPGLPANDDARTWKRIGIQQKDGGADLHGVVPDDPPPAREPAAKREPVSASPDTSAPTPFPKLPASPEPRDTVRIPETAAPPAAAPPVRRDTSATAPARGPRDTLRIPAPSTSAPDTIRIPGPFPGETPRNSAVPEAEPQTPAAPATPG